MLHHRLSAHGFEVIDLGNRPALRRRIGAGSVFMMLWTLALSLILRRDADPDADALG